MHFVEFLERLKEKMHIRYLAHVNYSKLVPCSSLILLFSLFSGSFLNQVQKRFPVTFSLSSFHFISLYLSHHLLSKSILFFSSLTFIIFQAVSNTYKE